jgi:2-methylcitrate dehydratase PrpD
VLGIEVECRLLDPRVAGYKFAWSPTTTSRPWAPQRRARAPWGSTSSRLHGRWGIAATQASGLRETGGTMSKALNAGQAARCGLAAALLAARGFTGSETALEGPNGFIAAFGEARDVEVVVDAWGQTYQIEMNTFKPFPCGIVTHAAIDACLELYQLGVRGEVVRSVQLNVHPVVARLTGRENPRGPARSEVERRPHRGRGARLRQGRREGVSPACIADPQVVRLRKSTSTIVEEHYAMDEAEVAVTLADGRVVTKHIEHAVGSLERPMSDAGLEGKLKGLAEDVLTDAQTNELIGRVWSLDKLEDASALARACATP